jgi:hypothetical protein
MPAPSVLDTGTFWRQLFERAGRQAAQTAAPIIVTVAAVPGTFRADAAGLAIAVAVTLTILKALAGIQATPD